MSSFKHVVAVGLALVFGMACGASLAQDFPKKGNVEMTVLFPAGTSADVTARALAAGMAKQLGVNVAVVNRPGAGGAIGYRHVAAQKPDGYAMVWNSNSISTTYHSGQLPFDYRNFEPVARALVESVVVAVRTDSKWKTLKELIADAKARPGEITVPYSASQIIPNLMGGHVDVVIQFPGALAGNVSGGKIRLLAALSSNRDPSFPDVPLARELGLDVTLDAWRGVAVPKGTPKNVIAALEKAVRETVQSPEFAAAAAKLYVSPGFLPAQDFGQMIAKEDAALARVMKDIGLAKAP
jgi:tripartite-type tricarboxylate transporter receptor subunit TctC